MGDKESDEDKSFWRHNPKAVPAKPITLITQSPKEILNVEPQTPDSTGVSSIESFQSRELKIEQLLEQPIIDLEQLKRLAWKGAPSRFRPLIWKILIGYLPNIKCRHSTTLNRKHTEYREIIDQFFSTTSRRDETIMHQIAIDVPRTAPDLPLFRNPFVRESIARILYCCCIRRPASGYVQGINDLVTPFYDVFFGEKIPFLKNPDGGGTVTVSLTEDELFEVEADTFWCLSKLLDGIQENYTFNQRGIIKQLDLMEKVLSRTDPQLLSHLRTEGIQLIQIAFRWINCLLLREFPLSMIIRLWDTYFSESDMAFSHFHPYVCAALLGRWSEQIQLLEFQDIILFLQKLPTEDWTKEDLEVLLSEAFVWKTVFNDAN